MWEEWTRQSGDLCVTQSGDGAGEYPRALRLPAGKSHARFVLHTPLEPRRVSISVDPDPGAVGGDEIQPNLSERPDGQAWRASFSIVVPPHAYIDLYAKWPPCECGPPRHLLERFHLAAAGPR